MSTKTKEQKQQQWRQEYLRRKERQTPEQLETLRKKAKEYYYSNKGKVLVKSRKHHLKKTYGLSAEEYFKMILLQKNKCAICGNEEHRLTKTGDIKPLSVDHNHTTGEIRELLCNDCNALLGFSNENITILQKAIEYLEKHMDYFTADVRKY